MAQKLKSTSKLIKDINFNKEITITNIYADPTVISQQKARLSNIKNNGNALAPEVVDAQIQYTLFKDNIFSAAMTEIADNFEFNIDKEELKNIIENIKNTFRAEKADIPSDDKLELISDRLIKKTLIFAYLATLWNIKVNDDEVKNMLDVFYQNSNQPINEVLNDPEKFEKIRETIIEEKLVLCVINAFPVRFKLMSPDFSQKDDESKKDSDDKGDKKAKIKDLKN